MLTKLIQGAFICLLVIVSFILAALLAFVPLTALPGDLQTGFVNASWVKGVWITVVVLVLVLRCTPSAFQQDEVWWRSTVRGLWTFISTFVGIFWLTGGLVWINAYGVESARTHDMVVTGYDRAARSAGGSAIEHYKLSEIGTSWKADLESTDERDRFARRGTCVRVVVREGRFGLDWISDAARVNCPEASKDADSAPQQTAP